jgi:hypothetical protein
MEWAGYVASIKKVRIMYRIKIETTRGDHLGDQGVKSRNILKWTLKKKGVD